MEKTLSQIFLEIPLIFGFHLRVLDNLLFYFEVFRQEGYLLHLLPYNLRLKISKQKIDVN